MKTKICIKCKKEFINTDEFFFKTKTGLSGQCKKCSMAYSKEFRRRNPAKLKIYADRSNARKKERRKPTLEALLNTKGDWIDANVICNNKYSFFVYGYYNSLSIETFVEKVLSERAIANSNLLANGEDMLTSTRARISTVYHNLSTDDVLNFIDSQEGLKTYYTK